MTDTPVDNRCRQFADYVLEGYIAPTSTYPPSMWASIPEENSKRTNNGPEGFPGHCQREVLKGCTQLS
jgi:hypothetical protein